jgi:hypothetical protein
VSNIVGAGPQPSQEKPTHGPISEDEGDRWEFGYENPELSTFGRYQLFSLHVTLAPDSTLWHRRVKRERAPFDSVRFLYQQGPKHNSSLEDTA